MRDHDHVAGSEEQRAEAGAEESVPEEPPGAAVDPQQPPEAPPGAYTPQVSPPLLCLQEAAVASGSGAFSISRSRASLR